MDPEHRGVSLQVGDGGVTEVLLASLDVSHVEVDGEDDGDADTGDDNHEHQQVSLEPDVLDGVNAALSQNHVIRQSEDAQHPGTHASVHLVHVSSGDGVSVSCIKTTIKCSLIFILGVLRLVLREEYLSPARLVVILPDQRQSAIVPRSSPQNGEQEQQHHEPDLNKVELSVS